MSTRLLIQRLLDARPMSAAELTIALNAKKNTVKDSLTRMRRARQIYVADWTKRPGKPRPIYALGDQEDKPAPKPRTPQQKNRLTWRSIKADPERYLRRLKQHRASALARLDRKADPVLSEFAGLFGSRHQEAA
jgi:predicted ArsR family transcriptional regulator